MQLAVDPREVHVFTKYLTGRNTRVEGLENRYAYGIAQHGKRLTPRDARLLRIAVNLPVLIGPLDAACALIFPESVLRQRLLFLSAIIECSTAGYDLYMPVERPPWYAARVIGACAAAAAKAAVGLAILTMVR